MNRQVCVDIRQLLRVVTNIDDVVVISRINEGCCVDDFDINGVLVVSRINLGRTVGGLYRDRVIAIMRADCRIHDVRQDVERIVTGAKIHSQTFNRAISNVAASHKTKAC